MNETSGSLDELLAVIPGNESTTEGQDFDPVNNNSPLATLHVVATGIQLLSLLTSLTIPVAYLLARRYSQDLVSRVGFQLTVLLRYSPTGPPLTRIKKVLRKPVALLYRYMPTKPMRGRRLRRPLSSCRVDFPCSWTFSFVCGLLHFPSLSDTTFYECLCTMKRGRISTSWPHI